ncbi:MAG: hypothetical protein HN348_33145, partial [Proteobacteria bacterium]|nr:hypothetical protein [Pseudomonadota bacterium]
DGFGPETITIDSASSGTYSIRVHYFGEWGAANCASKCLLSEATVKIYMGGILAATYSRILTDQGEVWKVADIEYPSGTITPVDKVGSTVKVGCY